MSFVEEDSVRGSSPVLHGFGQGSLPTSGSIGSSGHPPGSEIKITQIERKTNQTSLVGVDGLASSTHIDESN
jgi:hypothetical protein